MRRRCWIARRNAASECVCSAIRSVAILAGRVPNRLADRPLQRVVFGGLACIYLMLLVLSYVAKGECWLAINCTESLPLGVYVKSSERPTHGSIVEFDPPAGRSGGLPFLKVIAGVEGDWVSSDGESLSVNDVLVTRLARWDAEGNEVVYWRGSRRLTKDEWLVVGHKWNSLDSRIYGPISSQSIRCCRRPLVTTESPMFRAIEAAVHSMKRTWMWFEARVRQGLLGRTV